MRKIKIVADSSYDILAFDVEPMVGFYAEKSGSLVGFEKM